MLDSHAGALFLTNFNIFIRILGSKLKSVFLYMSQTTFVFSFCQKSPGETFVLKRPTGKQSHFTHVLVLKTCGLASTSQIRWRGEIFT